MTSAELERLQGENERLLARLAVIEELVEARAKHPSRFQRRPTPPTPPAEVWINPPITYTA